MKTVLVDGCFDLLHVGHLWHLEEARKHGDRLVVSLTVDEVIREQKGAGRPIFPWKERAMLLRGLRAVDEVIETVGGLDALRLVRPQVFCKGSDYAHALLDEERALCKELGVEFIITEAMKVSTTETIKKVLENDARSAPWEGHK